MKLVWDIDDLLDFKERLEDTEKFETYLKKVTKELAKELQDMLIAKTPVKTGNLAANWGGKQNSAFTIVESATGYKITLRNDAANDDGYKYAYDVNYGHRVRNSPNGEYLQVKRRTVPYYDGNQGDYFVYGHFFVEKSVLAVEGKCEAILYAELEKWWRWCISG